MSTQVSTRAKSFIPSPLSIMALAFAFIPVYLLVKGVYGFGSIIKAQVQEAEKHQYAKEVSASETLEITCSSESVRLPESGFVPTAIYLPKSNVILPIKVVDASNPTSVMLDPDTAYAPAQYSIVRNASDFQHPSSVGLVARDSKDGLIAIKKLVKHDKIQIFSKEYTAEYEVNEVNAFFSSKEDPFSPKPQPTLTVATANNIFSKRTYITRASLVSVKANCYDTIH